MQLMYHRYFGLQEEPFSIAVNPRYLFMSHRHRDALAHLLYGVGAGGGFVLLTGEVGTGKTTINRCLLEQLPANTDIAIVLNPALNALELLATVCDELDIDCAHGSYTLKSLTDALHKFLLENHARERRTVLLIDEAQHLQFDALEQIRLLTNLETNTQKLLQIILVAQPELSAVLARPELRQLSQRISARFELQPLNLVETHAYISHRLQVAGMPASQGLFPAGVVRAIYKQTGGIPRLINLLCERMLLGSYGQNKTTVDMSVFRAASAEVFGSQSATGKQTARGVYAAACLVLLVLCWLAWQYLEESRPNIEVAPAAAALVGEPLPQDELIHLALRQPAYAAAVAELGSFLGAAVSGAQVDCAQLERVGWYCLQQRVETWNQLIEFDRPVVLSLVTPGRYQAYAVVTAIADDQAQVLVEGRLEQVPLRQLAEWWRGDFTLLWQPPEYYQGLLKEGDQGPMVTWLAQAFAVLDVQTRPLAQQVFNAALAERVRYFQRETGLLDDGVVGVKTLLKLQQAQNQAVGLLPQGPR